MTYTLSDASDSNVDDVAGIGPFLTRPVPAVPFGLRVPTPEIDLSQWKLELASLNTSLEKMMVGCVVTSCLKALF
jgi:hypothetical protein